MLEYELKYEIVTTFFKMFIIGCKGHHDCPGKSYCFNGRCEMGKPKEITLYIECGSGFFSCLHLYH